METKRSIPDENIPSMLLDSILTDSSSLLRSRHRDCEPRITLSVAKPAVIDENRRLMFFSPAAATAAVERRARRKMSCPC